MSAVGAPFALRGQAPTASRMVHQIRKHGSHSGAGLRRAAFLVAVAAAALAPAPAARAAFPGANGRIAYTSSQAGNTDVFSMTAVGGPTTRLTTSLTPEQEPAHSADGRKIAYALAGSGGALDIWTMAASGTGQANVTSNAAADFDPTWSPGGRIAFVSDRAGNNDIWAMSADGSSLVNLTAGSGADERDPAWSADGTKIAFSRWQSGNFDVWVMNSDGSGAVNLTSMGGSQDAEHPAWSPDGTKIAFTYMKGSNFDVIAMNSDGTGQVNLTSGVSGIDEHPAWSPDGTKIAFHSTRSGNGDIWVMSADGSSPVNYTGASSSADISPDWAPVPPAPAAPTVTAVSPASPANDNAPKVTGTAPAGTTVTLYAGAACSGAPAATGTGAEFAGAGIAVPVADDSVTVLRATATDDLGGASACSPTSVSFAEDSTAPAVPAAPGLDPQSDTGASSTDGITQNASPTVRGSAENGAKVQVAVDGQAADSVLAAGGSWTLPLGPLAEGQHAVTAIAADPAGNTSAASTALTLGVDGTAPAAPGITSGPPSPSANDLPDWSFTGEPGATFECGLSRGVIVVSPQATCASPASFDLAAEPDGAYDFAVRQTDLAGNAGPATKASYTFDTSLPDPGPDPLYPGEDPPLDPGEGDPGGALPGATPASPALPRVRARVLRLVGDRVLVPVSCPAEADGACGGVLSLYADPSAAVAGRVRASRRGRKLMLGTARFRVRRGRTAAVEVQVSRRGRRLFGNRDSLRAEVRLDTRGRDGRVRRTRHGATIRKGRGRSARR